MSKQKISFIILFILVGFLSSTMVGFWQSKQTNDNNQVGSLTKIIRSYNPAGVVIYWGYFGTLNELSEDKIRLTTNNGEKEIIAINSDMKKIMLYDFRIDKLKHLPANKTDFFPGAKIIYSLGADWLNNKITNAVLELDLRK